MGQFAELSLSAGHHRRQRVAAAGVGPLGRGLAFILYGTVLELNYYGVVPSYCTTHPERKTSAGDHLRQSVRVSGGRVSGGLSDAKLRQVGVQLKDTSGALERPAGACTKTSFTRSAAD